MPKGFLPNFLKFLTRGFNYSEEGVKYSPELIVMQGFDFKFIPLIKKVPISNGLKSGKDLEKQLKPLIPFCDNGWVVYLDLYDGKIEFGVVRVFSGAYGLNLEQTIFDEVQYNSSCLLHLNYVNDRLLKVTGLQSKINYLSISFISHQLSECNIQSISDDCCLNLKDLLKDNSKKAISKFLKYTLKSIHGTIIVVVNDDGNSLRDSILKDGLWLFNPIDLAREIDDYCVTEGKTQESYYGLSGLIKKMIEFDGITVFNSSCQILAFNCFIRSGSAQKKVNGGARKRAAYDLLESSHPSILGVFFQSHDGTSFYSKPNYKVIT